MKTIKIGVKKFLHQREAVGSPSLPVGNDPPKTMTSQVTCLSVQDYCWRIKLTDTPYWSTSCDVIRAVKRDTHAGIHPKQLPVLYTE